MNIMNIAKSALVATKELGNGQWCYADCDGLTKHGQHYKSTGACGFVNFTLFDGFMADLARKRKVKTNEQ